jgi:hypothetical protein
MLHRIDPVLRLVPQARLEGPAKLRMTFLL